MPTKINLLVYLAVWRRPEITELCLLGIERMRMHPAYNIQAFAVISEPEMIPLMEKYNIGWAMHENLPVSKKKNYGLKALSAYQFDYMMEIGSDDLVTDYLLTQYVDYFGKYEYFGISDCLYISVETDESRRLINHQSTYGAARVISRSLLEKMNWSLWPDNLNRGMDNASNRNIAKHGVNFYRVPAREYPGLIDVKSQENIWKFNYFLGVEYDFKNVMQHLSTAEIDKIKQLQNAIA